MPDEENAGKLSTDGDCWSELTVKSGKREPFSRADAKHLVVVAHQGLAIAEAIRQVGRIEEAADALERSTPTAGGVAPDTVGIEVVDRLRDATMPVFTHYREQRALLRRVLDPALRALHELGVRGRVRSRLGAPLTVAAAMVLLACERRGLRAPSPLEMEALVRLCGDRDLVPASPLDDEAEVKTRANWKSRLHAARSLVAVLEKLEKPVAEDGE